MKKTSKVLGLIAIIAVIALNVLLMIGCSDDDDSSSTSTPPIAYVINGSGKAFTATKGGATVGTAAQPIQTVIESIRTDAAGKNVAIQFGDGTAVLDIGQSYITFSNTDSKWGEITLTGKLTSDLSTTSYNTINISSTVSVTSSADIANTSTYSSAKTFYSSSTGTVNITGGTLYNPNGYTVYHSSSGTLTISGGTIKSDSGWSVYNYSNGKIIVSGSANITSGNTSGIFGTIYISDTNKNITADTVSLEITGGTVTNTSTTTGNAIYNNNKGKVNITGGKVSKAGTTGNAIYNASTGVVTIGTGATIEGNTVGVTP